MNCSSVKLLLSQNLKLPVASALSLMQLMIHKHENFKYTTASQRLNFFSLFYISLFHRSLSHYFFSNSHAQRSTTSIIFIAYHILWEFLLCNVLCSVGIFLNILLHFALEGVKIHKIRKTFFFFYPPRINLQYKIIHSCN